ncbi:MAG: hypothetical protein JXD18_03800 [Anaerolineae bacterium]|nr:hypothetical protein [Anaerolineae bacterium]
MKVQQETWEWMQTLSADFVPFYWRDMQAAIADVGIGNNWFALSHVRGCDPQPLSLDHYCTTTPYSARQVFVDRLEGLAQLELLERVGESAYRLTDLGRRAVESIFAPAHAGLDTVTALSAAEGQRLADLLLRIVTATMEAPDPASKWAMECSRWTDPGVGASFAARIDQYITDLYHYRDDAHLAAWQPYDVSGHAWEIFTFIWRDTVATAAEMAERMAQYRGHTTADYQAALDDLAGRGWVVERDGRYELTDAGRRLREDAEAATDRHFFAGWGTLDDDELLELRDLLAAAHVSLQREAQRKTWAVVQALAAAVPAAVRDEIGTLFDTYGLNEPRWSYGMLLAAASAAPNPISASTLSVTGVYTRPAHFSQMLADVAAAGFLEAVAEGQYTFTEKGRSTLHELHDAFYAGLGRASTLPAEDLAQAEALMGQIVAASLSATEPEAKPALTATHRRHPQGDYPPLARIDNRLDDLHAFRDDAHIAAWQPSGVSGHAWEALTFLWRDAAHTAADLVEKLPYRNYAADDYEAALQDLVSRGWVTTEAGGYRVTEKGQALRQQAEDETDRLFFAPWECLHGFELGQLYAILARLLDDIRPEAAT